MSAPTFLVWESSLFINIYLYLSRFFNKLFFDSPFTYLEIYLVPIYSSSLGKRNGYVSKSLPTYWLASVFLKSSFCPFTSEPLNKRKVVDCFYLARKSLSKV